jgi:hypothetical protein
MLGKSILPYLRFRMLVLPGIKEEDMDSACGTIWEGTKCIQGFWRKPAGKRPLERPRCRWKNNIKLDIKLMEWEVMDWFHLAQDVDTWQALVNTVMNLRLL